MSRAQVLWFHSPIRSRPVVFVALVFRIFCAEGNTLLSSSFPMTREEKDAEREKVREERRKARVAEKAGTVGG